MKEKYIPAELEVILFDMHDVITASGQRPEQNQGGTGIGGGYNPGGWT